MPNKLKFAIQGAAVLIAGAISLPFAGAQTPPAQQTPATLALTEQLKDDYKVGKPKEPGSVLVVQPAGAVGAPVESLSIPQAKYQLGVFHPPSTASIATIPKKKELKAGEKVYVSQIALNSKDDSVTIDIFESGEPGYKSEVVFAFPSKFLASAQAWQIEETIGKVLAFDTSASQTQQPAEAQEQRPATTTGSSVDSVIDLVNSGMSESLIIKSLQAQNKPAVLRPADLVRLQKGGVSENVISVMMDPKATPAPPVVVATLPPPAESVAATTTDTSLDHDDPTSPHDPGIYLYEKGPDGKMRMVILDRGAVQYKNPRIQGQLINIGPAALLEGTQASVHTKETMPVFYFSWENTGAQLPWDQSLTTPNYFRLIRLDTVKNTRKATLAPGNVITKGAIRVRVDRVGNRFLYKVTPLESLLPGEYAFIANAALTNDVFDFGASR